MTQPSQQMSYPSPSSGVFKRCTMCGNEWQTKEEFLGDADIHLNGYQWNRKKFRMGEDITGLLIFTHKNEKCGTTLAISARKFRSDGDEEDLDRILEPEVVACVS